VAFFLVAAWSFAFAASGEIITFNFTGAVESVYNPFGVVSPSFARIGDPVQISLRYDTTSPDGYNDDPTRGSFVSPGWFKVEINGAHFENTSLVQIDVIHASAVGGQEFFQVLPFGGVTAWPAELPQYPYRTFGFAAWETGPPYDFLSSDQLPLALDLSRTDIRNGGVSISTDTLNMYEIQFTFSQVPEPGVSVLLGAGLVLMMGKRSIGILSGKSGAAKEGFNSIGAPGRVQDSRP